MIAAEVSGASKGSVGEQTQIRSGLRERITDRYWRTRGIKVGALWLPGVSGVCGSEDLVRKAGGESCDAGHLPSFKDRAGHAFGEMRASAADRELPTIVEHQPLPYIEVRIATLGGEIEGVARESLIARCGHERVGRIVNGMRPGVRGFDG